MGRARCTWQLCMGGSRGRRPSFRMVSFCACLTSLQKIRHFQGCNFQLFWPSVPKDCSESCLALHQLLALSCTDSSHSSVSSQVEILVVNKIPYSSSWRWSSWSVVILNLKTRVQNCIYVFFSAEKQAQLSQIVWKLKKEKGSSCPPLGALVFSELRPFPLPSTQQLYFSHLP